MPPPEERQNRSKLDNQNVSQRSATNVCCAISMFQDETRRECANEACPSLGHRHPWRRHRCSSTRPNQTLEHLEVIPHKARRTTSDSKVRHLGGRRHQACCGRGVWCSGQKCHSTGKETAGLRSCSQSTGFWAAPMAASWMPHAPTCWLPQWLYDARIDSVSVRDKDARLYHDSCSWLVWDTAARSGVGWA